MIIVDKMFSLLNISQNKRKVIRNVYWGILGKVVSVLNSLFIGVLVARYLGPASYGLMNYAISFVTIFSVISNFGLDNIEIRELAKQELDKNKIIWTSFVLRLLFGGVAILLVTGILLSTENDSNTIVLVMIYSLTLVFNSAFIIRNYFTSQILNKYVIRTEIIRTIICASIKIVLLAFKLPLIWFIITSVFDTLLLSSGYILAYKRRNGNIRKWKYDKAIAKYLIKESFPMLLSSTAVLVYQRIDQIIIKNLIDNESVGQFAAASKIAEIAIYIPITISQSISPLLVKAKQKSFEYYVVKRQEFMDIMVWSAIVISIGVALLAQPTVYILFGNQYSESIDILKIIAWKTVFVSLFSASGQIILIEHLQKFAAIRNLIGCFVAVTLNYILIPYWGVIGSAWAALITFIVTGYISHLFIRPYRFMFKVQSASFVFGWKMIYRIKLKKR